MIEVKNSEYGLYQGNLYRIGKTCVASVDLCSINPDDLNNGFICNHTEDFIKKYGFVCIKEVPKSEITEAYKIETTAIYKTQKYYVDRASTQGEDMVRIYTPPISTVKETELYNEYKKNGFSDGMKFEYGDVLLYKYVSVNDPDLQIVEKRTKLDISKL